MAEGRLTRIEGTGGGEVEIRPGDYWRRLSPHRPDGYQEIEQGELALVVKIDEDDDRVWVTSPCAQGSQTGWKTLDFLASFEYVPDGQQQRDEEIARLMRESTELSRQAADLQRHVDLGAALPQIPMLAAGAEEDDEPDEGEEELPEANEESGGEEPGGALILRQDAAALRVREMKVGAARVRNHIAKTRLKLKKKAARINALVKEKQTALEAMMTGLTSMMKVGEEVIWTLNIYLGRGEQVWQIASGEPAPVDELISVRQRVLYADEECALDANAGGLDFQKLEEFYDWLMVPKNLQQVLPEPKGIIAFKPRRHAKEKYKDDSWAQGAYNEANAKTFFLIRNGENLYAVVTDLEVGSVLFPKRDDFEQFYFSEERDWSSGRLNVTREPLRPGSPEFAKAMKAADALQRHYGRVLLFMQGLIDRTKVFEPLQGEQVNLLSRRTHENWIRYVYDAEMLLPTGRLSFDQWLEELNSTLDVGHRIMGVFGGYGRRGLYDREGRHTRIKPNGAPLPESLELHTLEEREGDMLVFYYKRTDKRWTEEDEPVPGKPGWVYRNVPKQVDYKTRASCRVERDDDFILNIDEAKLEDIEFYLTSRVDRHRYIDLFPLLEAAAEVKRREAEQEAPFLQLLVGRVMQEHGATLEDAEAAVPELVHWWKFKNRTHRALTSDDQKAVTMIVQEYGIRARKAAEVAKREAIEPRLVEAVQAAAGERHVLYVGHYDYNLYRALLAQNESNVFVEEQEWKFDIRTGKAVLAWSKPWRTTDSRRLRWREIYSSERYAEWRHDLRREAYLTDEELDAFTAEVLTKGDELLKWMERYGYESKKATREFLPLAVSMNVGQDVTVWFGDNRGRKATLAAKLGEDDDKWYGPTLAGVTFEWTRQPGGALKWNRGDGSHYSYKVHKTFHRDRLPEAEEVPWITRLQRESAQMLEPGQVKPRLLWSSHENLGTYAGWWAEYEKVEERFSRCDSMISRAYWRVVARMKERREELEFEKYLVGRHGDPELWEEERESLKLKDKDVAAEGLRKAMRQLVYRGRRIDGMTVAEVLDAAGSYGKEINLNGEAAELAPYDMVLDTRDEKSEEEVEPEDYADGGEEERDDEYEEA